MKISKAWILILFFQIPLYHVFGQDSLLKSYNFNLKFHHGFIINHSINMAHLANQRPNGIEVDVFKRAIGNKLWQQVHNYPIIGYSFQYFKMDKNKPLGDSYSLVIYYGKYLVKTPKSSLSFRAGIGPGYIEKRFDRNSNYKNNLISTRFNFALNGRINYTYNINKHINISAGIGIIHFSNGAFKVPNLGINIPSAHIGVGFSPETSQSLPEKKIPVLKKETQFLLTLAGGLKQVYPVDGPIYLISTLSGNINRKVSHKSGLNIGTDIFYDNSNKKIIDTLTSGRQKIKYFKWGIAVGHELYVGKISMLTQLGYYIYDPLRLERKSYQRLALKYYFSDSMFGLVGLKLHLGQADLVEWGIGIKI